MMGKGLLAGLIMLLAGLSCLAQAPQSSFPPGAFQSRAALDAGGAAAYQGPGNVVSGASDWWGFRAYNATYAASLGKIANICTPLDAVCADVNSDVNGNFNLSGTGSLVCNNVGSICTVKTLYTQTGNTNCAGATACNLTEGAIFNRPTLLINAVSTFPCASFLAASTQRLRVTLTSAVAQPYTLSTVANRTGNTSAFNVSISGGSFGIYFNNSANQIILYAGSVSTAVTANDNSFHAVNGVFSGASSAIQVDGTDNTSIGNPDVNSFGTVIAMGSDATTSSPLTGIVCEAGEWGSGFSGTQRTNMNNNQRAYWGF